MIRAGRRLAWIGLAWAGLLGSPAARAADAPPPAPPAPAPAAPAPAAPDPAAPAPSGGVPGARLPFDSGEEMPLTLAEASRMAVARNLEMAAAAYDPAIAAEGIAAAEGFFDTLITATFDAGTQETPSNIAFQPSEVTRDESVGWGFGASRALKNGGRLGVFFRHDRLFTTSAIATRNPSWTATTSIEYAQPLLRGAGDVATADIRLARAGAQAADWGYRAKVEDVLLRTEVAYWNLVFVRSEVQSRRKSEEVARELLEQTKARFEAKVATVLDVADARAGYEGRRGDRIVAEGAEGLAADALRALILPFDPAAPAHVMLVPLDDPGNSPASENVEPARDAERLVGQAVRGRPELRAAQADLEARGIDVEVASDALKPQLDLVARLSTAGLDGGYGSSLGEMVEGQALGASVGLQFSVYIGRRTAHANLCAAQWARSQAGLRMRELENRIVQEVRAALREIATSRARLQAAEEEIRASREALDGEQLKERNGESTPFRVLEKEDIVRQAELRGNRAAVDVRIAIARAWKSAGLLADLRGVAPPAAPR